MIGGIANKSLLMTESDLKFRSPFGMILSGPTGSGKTTLLLKLLKCRDSMITPPPTSILFCYGEFDNHVVQLQQEGITVCSGLPSDQMLSECEKPCLLILDDLLSLAKDYIVVCYSTKLIALDTMILEHNIQEENFEHRRSKTHASARNPISDKS
ncbi:hypothetical protein DdX_19747 [Ditylenchus destructor]|uniref:AAA+ ATPase domain-containing protein n=1 Tax=Ditylenchus destructor TaxID=166010 RepID=A0AAD4QX03_9BILA|nr:hypothetical protein DdX_19747 [Ditylenchus destructor]